MLDSTTRRAIEIREGTGCSWERACHLAELERDFPHVPAEWRDYARQNGWDARDIARTASAAGESVYAMDESLRDALANLVNYNYADEERDAEENGMEGHIFADIQRLDAWLRSNATR
jgi:hypothetical protein